MKQYNEQMLLVSKITATTHMNIVLCEGSIHSLFTTKLYILLCLSG